MTSERQVIMQLLPKETAYLIPNYILEFFCESEARTSKKKQFYRIFDLATFLFAVIFFVINLIHANDEEMFINTLYSVSGGLQGLLKFCLFIYYKSHIRKIMEEKISKFWIYNKNINETVNVIATNIYKKLKIIQTIMLLSGVLVVQLSLLKALFREKDFMMLEMWMFDIFAINAIQLLNQYYAFCISVGYMFGYDFIYLALCTDVVVQLKFLKYEIQHFKFEFNFQYLEIYKWIQHHQYL